MPISKSNEFKYRTIRRGRRHGLILDEVWEQQLRTHLLPTYRNKGETESTLILTGYIETLSKVNKWTATKADMRKYFALSEKLRWDKGFGLTKADAVANFFIRDNPRAIQLGSRPGDLASRRPYPHYKPRPFSSLGKIRTKQIGARRVQKDFENMMKAIFSITDGLRQKGQKRAKMPAVKIDRYIS
jgi:hypothetical protein